MTKPTTLNDFTCDANLRSSIDLTIQAAQKQKRPLPHTLITGPPGTGKTTLARILATEYGSKLHEILANTVTSPAQINNIILRSKPFDIIYIDEIHALPPRLSEIFYPIMEDNLLNITSNDRSISYKIHPLAIIGTTTEPSTLLPPFLDRFLYKIELSLYNEPDMIEIISRYMAWKPITLSPDCLHVISSVTRGTPRIATAYCDRIYDYIIVNDITTPEPLDIYAALKLIDVDKTGLTKTDYRIIETIFKSGSISQSNLSSVTHIPIKDLSQKYEPYLIEHDYITISSKGRTLSQAGYDLISSLNESGE